MPPTSHQPSEVKTAPAGKDSVEPSLLSKPGATDAAQEPIAVAVAANLIAESEEASLDIGSKGVNAVEPQGVPIPSANEGNAGHVDAANAPESTTVGASPRKRVQRMKREWTAEDPSQLTASEGDFVSVWVDTGTEHGWIHSELIGGASFDGTSKAGWLPVCVLQQLPENRRWMKTKQAWQAMGESQCNVGEGLQVVVWVDSRTAEGWIYVEASEDPNSSPGWLPDFCLEWNDD